MSRAIDPLDEIDIEDDTALFEEEPASVPAPVQARAPVPVRAPVCTTVAVPPPQQMVDEVIDNSTVMTYRVHKWKFLGVAETPDSMLNKLMCPSGHIQYRDLSETNLTCDVCQRMREERINDVSSGISGVVSGILSGIMKAFQDFGHSQRKKEM